MRFLLVVIFSIFLVFSCIFITTKINDSRVAEAVMKNNKFCGYVVDYYETRTSRSSQTYKYVEIKNDNLIKSFSLTYKTTRLNNLSLKNYVCITYYKSVFNEDSAINIVLR